MVYIIPIGVKLCKVPLNTWMRVVKESDQEEVGLLMDYSFISCHQ